jgi:hypothetical protein
MLHAAAVTLALLLLLTKHAE